MNRTKKISYFAGKMFVTTSRSCTDCRTQTFRPAHVRNV